MNKYELDHKAYTTNPINAYQYTMFRIISAIRNAKNLSVKDMASLIETRNKLQGIITSMKGLK